MKYRIRIHDRTYEVELSSLQDQPIIARVDGESFEVWLEGGEAQSTLKSTQSSNQPPADSPNKMRAYPTATQTREAVLRSPIPGVIQSISVQPGDQVAYGQELCVLDAMKMKNPIRSPRQGEIAAVRVAVGQTVKHNDILIEFVPG